MFSQESMQYFEILSALIAASIWIIGSNQLMLINWALLTDQQQVQVSI